jgi:histidinol dehydrogenase
MKLRRLSTAARGFDAKLAALTRFEASADGKVRSTVARILADVRAHGDAALLKYTKTLDKVSGRPARRFARRAGQDPRVS